MSSSPRICHVRVLVLALSVACGPGPDTTTSASIGTVADTSSTEATAASTTPSTTEVTAASALSSTGVTTTGDGNPCGCADDEVCVQRFDGVCTLYGQSCEPNPDTCVPRYPCAPACQPLCDVNDMFSCNHSDCPGEVDGAVHCFGH